MSCCVSFEFWFASQPYMVIVMITSLRNVLSVFVVVRSLGVGCSRWTWRVIVLSTCPLYPRDETVLPPLRIPGWRWLGGWTLTRKSNGEHGSSDSGPGPELFLHRDCSRAPAAYPLEFLGRSSRGGLRTSCFSCCDARHAQVWSSPSLAEETVFLFRPSMIPVLNVVRRWSPFASASGLVALSWTVIISVILLCYVFKWYYIFNYCMLLLYPQVHYIHCLDGMTLWLSFGS